jgi:hypothetical protein
MFSVVPLHGLSHGLLLLASEKVSKLLCLCFYALWMYFIIMVITGHFLEIGYCIRGPSSQPLYSCLIRLAKMIESLRKVFATIWGMDIKGKSLTFKKSAYLGEASI